ncbi:MAG TPA: NnrU family protein [Thermodesulfobacteriota bacterium]|nr:NnrU family protein [Thermodesulfobacteriota bacterium]
MTRRTRLLDYALIVLAAVFGIDSILLLIARGSSGYTHFGWSEVNILLWDTLLSLIFFVQHSGMVRRSFRARLASVVQARYQGAIYTIASGIALTVVVFFWQRSETGLVVLQGTPRLIATACSLLSALVFVLSAYSLRSFDPLGIGPIRSHLRAMDRQPGPFVMRGPYRWVRHPLYSCILVLFWANPDLTLDQLLFNLLWTSWIYAGALLEERDLKHEFGDVYLRYQKAVPMLVPWRGPAAKMAWES